jgi:hypothetical protein
MSPQEGSAFVLALIDGDGVVVRLHPLEFDHLFPSPYFGYSFKTRYYIPASMADPRLHPACKKRSAVILPSNPKT